ncbi:MAG TPA: exodeoxyribonuclease VII large subunit [Candidatus Acidoferrales bacterium]|nr:exodeoxyribonuclease VII large subunit [Candidatus Acidoferrales bacterium]
MAQFTLNLVPDRKVLTVSQLTARIRDLLEGAFDDLWVEGEISNTHASQAGHIYFTLKDEKAQIRCACFRDKLRGIKFRPEDGLKVTVRGAVSVYEIRGEYQMYVTQIEPVGLGALQLAFEQLKQRLDAEGLFDPARKKPLPLLPRRIGLITSPTGAAVRDVLRILKRRFPNVYVLLYPVRVQGDEAPGEIAAALEYFGQRKAADVLLVVRGGGSLEDLWAFNEEQVARAIAACPIPVISGVGHETDFTIADFVADVRASTPSNAAEIVVRTRDEFLRHIEQLAHSLAQHVRLVLLARRARLHELQAHRGFRRLDYLLRQHRQRADELAGRLGELLRRRLELSRRRVEVAQARVRAFDFRPRIATLEMRLAQRRQDVGIRMERLLRVRAERIARLRTQLEERSPLRVLERGYAVAYDAQGNIVRSADQVEVGDAVSLQLARGRLTTEVRGKD